MHGPVLNRASMVIDAAINDQGIALAHIDLGGLGYYQRTAGAAVS
ncbi:MULTISPECIES: hypothetical protein [unclassified Bradyrhizobium]|nr:MULTISPECIES: hypothetical protein [unclassified Bradyrhizobium]